MLKFDEIKKEWKLVKPLRGHSSYEEAVERYFNILDPIFRKAKEICEFEFVLTLLRVRSLQDAGWDPFESLQNTFKILSALKGNIKNDYDSRTHISLFLYGLIIEASEPYEILANLFNVMEGDGFLVKNFHDVIGQNGKKYSPSPRTKIDQLKSRAKKNKFDLSLFDEFFDNKLRNAIFHSDYTLYGSEVRTMNPTKSFKNEEWVVLINRCLAYYETFVHLYYLHIGTYKEPTLIEPHKDFITHPREKITTIIRKNYGIIGIKDNWTPQELSQGYIPHLLGRFLPYESKLIEKGQLLLPENRIEKINAILKFLPTFLRKKIVKRLEKSY